MSKGSAQICCLGLRLESCSRSVLRHASKVGKLGKSTKKALQTLNSRSAVPLLRQRTTDNGRLPNRPITRSRNHPMLHASVTYVV